MVWRRTILEYFDESWQEGASELPLVALLIFLMPLKVACYFWPGSEAPIGGVLPTYFESYSRGIPYLDRVKQVLDWLLYDVSPMPMPLFIATG